MSDDFDETPTLRLVVELEDGELPDSRLAAKTLYIIHGASWLWEPVGCIDCVDAGEESASFCAANDPERFLCLRCGPLLEVPYVLRSDHRMQLGTLERFGEEVVEDSLLYPASNDPDELNRRLATMLEDHDF